MGLRGHFAGPKNLIDAAQTLTGAWADLGDEIDTRFVEHIGLYVELDINGSTNARVRMLAIHTSGGTEYTLPAITTGAIVVSVEPEYVEFNQDIDQNMPLSWSLDALIPYVQFQAMVGTVGGTAAQIDSAVFTMSY